MPPEVLPSQLAAEVLARVLCSERSDEDTARCRLRVTLTDRAVVRTVLSLLEEVHVDEWTDESDMAHRDYIGLLPCGLTLVVQTDPQQLPLVDLLGGGGSGGA